LWAFIQLNQEAIMNKDQVEGKAKDLAGRVERQAGEWTGNSKAQADGAMKQVEGKVQKAWGDVKDAGGKAAEKNEADRAADRAKEAQKETAETEAEEARQRRKAG
jgi:uncharacterized protein YjbJ (UPF0337 family)